MVVLQLVQTIFNQDSNVFFFNSSKDLQCYHNQPSAMIHMSTTSTISFYLYLSYRPILFSQPWLFLQIVINIQNISMIVHPTSVISFPSNYQFLHYHFYPLPPNSNIILDQNGHFFTNRPTKTHSKNAAVATNMNYTTHLIISITPFD